MELCGEPGAVQGAGDKGTSPVLAEMTIYKEGSSININMKQSPPRDRLEEVLVTGSLMPQTRWKAKIQIAMEIFSLRKN